VLWVLYRNQDGYTQAKQASKMKGIKEFMDEGALLGHLWMEGYLDVGDPLIASGGPKSESGSSDIYPRVSLDLEKKAKYRAPDSIRGGTWEVLERVLKKAGYFRGGFSKISVARDVSVHMIPDRNRSKSFQVFHEGLLSLLE
jgi:hypothetical protein